MKKILLQIKKSDYTRYLIKALALLILVFVLDYFTGRLLSYFYFKQESGFQYRTTYTIDKTTADLLIFGSSRANHHYHPGIFENHFNMSYYNSGRDGAYIFYHYAVLKGVLKRYSPKIIILDFGYEEFKKDQDSYDRISCLLPYYKKHPEIRDIIELKSPYEKIKLLSSIYPYNSSVISIAAGNMTFNNTRFDDMKGYIPLEKIMSDPKENKNRNVSYEMDTVKLRVFESFIRDCTDANIKLYIVCSPYFAWYRDSDSSITAGRSIAEKYKVEFLDYSHDSLIINRKELFADFVHLNDSGAKIFSQRITDKISPEKSTTVFASAAPETQLTIK